MSGSQGGGRGSEGGGYSPLGTWPDNVWLGNLRHPAWSGSPWWSSHLLPSALPAWVHWVPLKQPVSSHEIWVHRTRSEPIKWDGVMRWGWALFLLFQKFKWLKSSGFRTLNPSWLPYSVLVEGALWECSGKHSLWAQLSCLSHWNSHFLPQLCKLDFYEPDISWQSAWNMGKYRQVWTENLKT